MSRTVEAELESAAEKPETDRLSDLLAPTSPNNSEPRTSVPTQFEEQLSRDLLDDRQGRQYRQLAQQIIDQSPYGLATTQLFACTAQEWHAAETVARLGAALSELHCGDVLLVDADTSSKYLTEHFEQDDQRGLTEALQDGTEWRRLVKATSFECLRLLPVGRAAVTEPRSMGRRFAQLAHGLTQAFRFTLICGGAVEAGLTAPLARFCDVSYLLIQLGHTTAAEASHAVAGLHAAGARLLGCIATCSPESELQK